MSLRVMRCMNKRVTLGLESSGARVTLGPEPAGAADARVESMMRSTNSERKTPRPSLHRGETKKPDRAQTSARPTAVLPGQECARPAHARTQRTPPAGPRTPLKGTRVHPAKIQAAPLLRPAQGSRFSRALGPTDDQAGDRLGSVGMRGLTPRGKDAPCTADSLPLVKR